MCINAKSRTYQYEFYLIRETKQIVMIIYQYKLRKFKLILRKVCTVYIYFLLHIFYQILKYIYTSAHHTGVRTVLKYAMCFLIVHQYPLLFLISTLSLLNNHSSMSLRYHCSKKALLYGESFFSYFETRSDKRK